MRRRLAIIGAAMFCLADAMPAHACRSPVFVVAPEPGMSARAPETVKSTLEQALVFEEAGAPLRVVSYRLRILEGDARFEAGQIVELIAPDADVEACLEFLDPGAADEAGVLSGYVQFASRDEAGGFYVSRMKSRDNAYLRRTFPQRGVWRRVRFSAEAAGE